MRRTAVLHVGAPIRTPNHGFARAPRTVDWYAAGGPFDRHRRLRELRGALAGDPVRAVGWWRDARARERPAGLRNRAAGLCRWSPRDLAGVPADGVAVPPGGLWHRGRRPGVRGAQRSIHHLP